MNEDNKTTATHAGEPGGSSVSGHFHPKRRKGWKAWLWVLTALACVVAGVVIGAGLTVLHYKHRTIPRPPPPKEMADNILKRINNTVAVSAEENERLRPVIQEHMDTVRQIRRESWQSIGRQFDAMHRDVGEMLGPERGQKWQEAVDKQWPKRKRKPDSDQEERPGHGHDRDAR